MFSGNIARETALMRFRDDALAYQHMAVGRLQSVCAQWQQYYAQASPFEIIRDIVFLIVVARLLAVVEYYIFGYGLVGAIKLWAVQGARQFFAFVLSLPGMRQAVNKQVSAALAKLEDSVIQRDASIPSSAQLPERGLSSREIDELATKLSKLKRVSWERGRISGAVYHGGEELLRLQTHIYGQYTVANQLHPDCFPAVRQMESEVVSMVLELYNGPEGSCGTSTSGGTESLLLACLAAREKGRAERGITQPEIVAPITIHAGFDKAAYYFGMRLIHAPVDPKTFKVDLKAVERLISPNTVLIAGSAPNFPHGIIDDIEGLSDLALKYRLPLHVDACLGSFVVPFLSTFGVDVGKFDFRVPGVTSISCDTHKYGFAPKGSSIIMYRTPKLRQYQYFLSADWTGGVYGSPTLAGSRPGAIMAGCWATLLYMGNAGYRKAAQDIVGAAQKFKKTLDTNLVLKENVEVVGDPQGSVVAFRSSKVNIYDLSELLSKEHWHLSTLQKPAAIHVAFTKLTVPVVDELVAALEAAVLQLLEAGSAASSSDGARAIYGIAGSVKTPGVAESLAAGYLDFLYKL